MWVVAEPTDPKTPVAAPAREPNATLAWLASGFDWLLAFPLALFAEIGTLARLTVETVLWAVRPPYRFGRLVDEMEFIGVQSIAIVGLTGAYVGSVFSLQLVDGFRQFGAENQTGSVIGVALARELAPVFASLIELTRNWPRKNGRNDSATVTV